MKPKKLLAALLAAACFLGTTGCASQSIAATDLTKNVKKAEQTVCFDEDTQDKTIEEGSCKTKWKKTIRCFPP